MAILRLPRLAINWFSQPDMFRRYWDQFGLAIEGLKQTSDTQDTKLQEIMTDPITVADLPSTPVYPRRIVTDATTTTFHDIVAGGGTEIVPVYFDQTDWRIG